VIRIDTSGHGALYLPDVRLVLDGRHDDAAYALISHAHADHAPRSKTLPVVCSPLTGTLLRRRGFQGEILPLPFFEPLEVPDARLTLYPAGHISGSAMIFVETARGNLLYTGDFKNPPSPVTEGFALPTQKVDTLITEATFSLPIYRWKSHEVLFEQIRNFALSTVEEGKTPVFLAYSLGKTQELQFALAPTGLTVQLHASAFGLSLDIAAAGFTLGSFEPYNKKSIAGKALIVPGLTSVPDISSVRIAYVSGWALHEAVRQQQTIDERIVLSDHADFYAVLNLVRQLNPVQTYVTHSPFPEIVCKRLRDEGLNAEPLGLMRQQGED
jgi:putative mRNA 3-end processing factor